MVMCVISRACVCVCVCVGGGGGGVDDKPNDHLLYSRCFWLVIRVYF